MQQTESELIWEAFIAPARNQKASDYPNPPAVNEPNTPQLRSNREKLTGDEIFKSSSKPKSKVAIVPTENGSVFVRFNWRGKVADVGVPVGSALKSKPSVKAINHYYVAKGYRIADSIQWAFDHTN